MISESGASDDIFEQEIDKQVEEYRNSLLIFEFQKAIVKQNLDTIVEKEEIQDYYTNH